MKIIVLIGGGRTGIDFLQSLFDQHSEVSQLPGVFYFDEFWKDIKNENNLKFIIKQKEENGTIKSKRALHTPRRRRHATCCDLQKI